MNNIIIDAIKKTSTMYMSMYVQFPSFLDIDSDTIDIGDKDINIASIASILISAFTGIFMDIQHLSI